MFISDFFPRHHSNSPDTPPPAYTTSVIDAKGKAKESDADTPLSWVRDFLRSLVPEANSTREKPKESAFPQALAKAMNFCFAEMQHEGWSPEASAAAAQCGFEVSHKALFYCWQPILTVAGSLRY